MSELKREYQLTNEDEILDFLERRPTVAPLLFDIRSNIRRFFDEVPVRLNVSHDPGWPEEQPEQFANIQIDLAPQQAVDRLKAFDTEWWLQR